MIMLMLIDGALELICEDNASALFDSSLPSCLFMHRTWNQ